MMRREVQPTREDFAIVLEFLQHGHPFSDKRIPIAQVIGKTHLVLLEIVPKRDVTLSSMSEVYIGDDKRDEVHHVIGKIPYNKLTSTAKINFDDVMTKIIDEDPMRWVNFFNNAGPITTRLHQLELLPGIGKKHMWAIIDAREDKPFESFQDISDRVSLLPNPKELIIKRIKLELDDCDKYKVFVR